MARNPGNRINVVLAGALCYPPKDRPPSPAAFFTFVQLVDRDLLISVAANQPRERKHGWAKPAVAFLLPSWCPSVWPQDKS